jgi:phosphate transport system protein
MGQLGNAFPDRAWQVEKMRMIVSMDTRIAELETRILDLGTMVQVSISRAITALVRHDSMLARAIIKEDEAIDQAEVEVEELCVEILETLHPVGEDLRFVIAILKINDSLERIADLSENIAEVIVEVGDWERFRRVAGIVELGEQAQEMVRCSLDALVQRDTELARNVIATDDRMDEMHEQIKRRIEWELDRIPENANPLLKLEHVTRQFERMGDIATNIAEEVIYFVEGTIVRHK